MYLKILDDKQKRYHLYCPFKYFFLLNNNDPIDHFSCADNLTFWLPTDSNNLKTHDDAPLWEYKAYLTCLVPTAWHSIIALCFVYLFMQSIELYEKLPTTWENVPF